jgi:catechol 2,3-dioxygenase-like lactoylglutathione lyase family enzyme
MACVRQMEDAEMIGKKEEVRPHVSSKVRAFGRARIDIAQRVSTPQDWDALWKRPQQEFPFTWGKYWKQCVEYRVDDFAAEVGFLIDVLGLPVTSFSPSYAMFTSPVGDFYFSVVQAQEHGYSTPPESFRIQFMVADIFAVSQEMERRGIVLDQVPEPIADGSSLFLASFRTPHGINIDLWGEVTPSAAEPSKVFQDEAQDIAEVEADVSVYSAIKDQGKNAEEFDQEEDEMMVKDSLEEDSADDFFEEIEDTPPEKPSAIKKSAPQSWKTPENVRNETVEEPQYVDETEVEYETYQPIPLK